MINPETNPETTRPKHKKTGLLNPRNMVIIALLASIAFILTLEGVFRWRLPIFPGFLAMDVADIPAVIGSVALGPVAGVWILGIRNILDVLVTGTASAGIGPLANFIFGCAYILPFAYIYNRFGRTTKGFVIGAAAGTLISTITAALVNYYMLIPAFAYIFGGMDNVVGRGTEVNDNINSLFTLVLYAIIPFNLLKNALVSVGGLVIYKAFGPVMAVLAKK